MHIHYVHFDDNVNDHWYIAYRRAINDSSAKSKDARTGHYVYVLPIWKLIADNCDKSTGQCDGTSDSEDVEHQKKEYREELKIVKSKSYV